MKLPSVYFAACLAAGILVGPAISARFAHPIPLPLLCALAIFMIVAGVALFVARRDAAAWVAALLAWVFLGALVALSQPLGLPANHVSRLIADGSAGASPLDLAQPLRWRGRLRADPLRLPWGTRYVIDLDSVQSAGEWLAVAGGLRADAYGDEQAQGAQTEADPAPSESPSAPDPSAAAVLAAPGAPAALRAGDRVEALLRSAPIRNFGDPGAFDYRSFLAAQGIDLAGTLRSAALLAPLPGPSPSLARRLAAAPARARGRLIAEINVLLADHPDRAAVDRAMLLGDRSFLDSDQIETFQQTGAYHVLVVAGLHVAVLVAALLWLCLRLPLAPATLAILAALAAYVAVVDDRPPILRAAMMAAAFLLGRLLYRRVDLLNAVGLAALLILAFRPSQLRDASFLLSFLAAATIAIPLLDRTTEKYRRALDHLGDVTRDAAHSPAAAQFRLDLRAASGWLAARLPARAGRFSSPAVAAPVRAALWAADLAILSFVIQLGMLPLLAQYFHRISIVAPAANLPAVALTGIIVPFGFAAMLVAALAGSAWPALAHLVGDGLSAAIGALLAVVHWFARPAWASWRVSSPPASLVAIFFGVLLLLAVAMLASASASAPGSARRASRPAAALAVALVALGVLIAAWPFAPRLAPGRLEVTTVLDVGQGDSIFVAFPDGRTMLVDGGGLPGGFYMHGSRPGLDIGEQVVSPYLSSRPIYGRAESAVSTLWCSRTAMKITSAACPPCCAISASAGSGSGAM